MLTTQSLLLALSATLAGAVKPLVVQGSFFVDSTTGNRFQIVGADYQPGGSAAYNPELRFDPLSNADKCMRDAALMQVMGINTIRVYNLDPDLNHDECASIFNAAGMYMILDVNSPLVGESLNADEPWTTYTSSYLNRTFAMIEAFKDYPNTLAFFSGNEVIQDLTSAKVSPPYIRAVTRDMKNYVAKHCSRNIPVGYSAADVREVLYDTFNYLQCSMDGKDDDPSRVDLFALNSYSWCGDSNFVDSTYSQLVDGLKGSSVPVFFSEYGCIKPAPRIFTEVATIYSPNMTGVFSGALVYEYAQEVSNFGLVNINGDGSAALLQDYYTLKNQFGKLNFTTIQGIAPPTTQAAAPPKCQSSLINNTASFDGNFTLPAVPPGAQQIIDGGVKPAPSGKIVPISNWNVKETVKNSDGSTIAGLAVVPLPNDEINRPGLNTANATGTASGSSSSSSNPAMMPTAHVGSIMGVMAGAALFMGAAY